MAYIKNLWINIWLQDIQHNDTQHNDTQLNDTQHKGLVCDTQQN
jgi:hypothetical protein